MPTFLDGINGLNISTVHDGGNSVAEEIDDMERKETFKELHRMWRTEVRGFDALPDAKELHSETNPSFIQPVRIPIRVVARIRPLKKKEKENGQIRIASSANYKHTKRFPESIAWKDFGFPSIESEEINGCVTPTGGSIDGSVQLDEIESKTKCSSPLKSLVPLLNKIECPSPRKSLLPLSNKMTNLADPMIPMVKRSPMKKESLKNVYTFSSPLNSPRTNGAIRGGSNTTTGSSGRSIIVGKNTKRFDYDAVFDETASQKEVYDGAIGEAIQKNIYRGYNTTILSYGQTGSGKTYTMGTNTGNIKTPHKKKTTCSPTIEIPRFEKRGVSEMTYCPESSWDDGMSSQVQGNIPHSQFSSPMKVLEDDGVYVRSTFDLFKAKGEHKGESVISLTFFEVYDNQVQDLLGNKDNVEPLQLQDHDNHISVKGLTSIEVYSAEQTVKLMRTAANKRKVGSTAVNSFSSRSHTICVLHVAICPALEMKSEGADWMDQANSEVISAKLTLVDLAGSERIRRTEVEGKKQKESIRINKDLFILGRVISILAGKKGKRTELPTPYRESKLSRLLQDSIGGNCCTVMIACIAPNQIDEAIETLRYAQMTRGVMNKAVQNLVLGASCSTESKALRKENKLLKAWFFELMEQHDNVVALLKEDHREKAELKNELSETQCNVSIISNENQLLINKLEVENSVCESLRQEKKDLKFRLDELSTLQEENLASVEEEVSKNIQLEQESFLLTEKVAHMKNDMDIFFSGTNIKTRNISEVVSILASRAKDHEMIKSELDNVNEMNERLLIEKEVMQINMEDETERYQDEFDSHAATKKALLQCEEEKSELLVARQKENNRNLKEKEEIRDNFSQMMEDQSKKQELERNNRFAMKAIVERLEAEKLDIESSFANLSAQLREEREAHEASQICIKPSISDVESYVECYLDQSCSMCHDDSSSVVYTPAVAVHAPELYTPEVEVSKDKTPTRTRSNLDIYFNRIEPSRIEELRDPTSDKYSSVWDDHRAI